MLCACGRKMIGNGVRMQRITEFEGGRFQPSVAEVRRLRCPGCGATDSTESPETEPGFRLSCAAADRVVQSALSRGMKLAGEEAGIDSASVSRLVSARSDRILSAAERPRIARLDVLQSGVVAVADGWSGEVSACFTGCDDARIVPWLSNPFPSVIVPGGELAGRALGWTGFKVSLAADTVMSMLAPLMERAKTRMVEAIQKRSEDGTIADLRARHFLRSSERLYAAMETSDMGAGRAALSTWIDECKGFWADVFQPVLRFLDTYGGCFFNHPICLEPRVPLALEFTGPANLMTLALDRKRQLDPTRGIELMMAGPRYDLRRSSDPLT